jgi:hypothetical protein
MPCKGCVTYVLRRYCHSCAETHTGLEVAPSMPVGGGLPASEAPGSRALPNFRVRMTAEALPAVAGSMAPMETTTNDEDQGNSRRHQTGVSRIRTSAGMPSPRWRDRIMPRLSGRLRLRTSETRFFRPRNEAPALRLRYALGRECTTRQRPSSCRGALTAWRQEPQSPVPRRGIRGFARSLWRNGDNQRAGLERCLWQRGVEESPSLPG